jgi:cobalamin biosynthesis Co2+ chelatase CbiK
MNGEDPMTLHSIGSMMNDFRCVKNSNKKVSFRDADGNFHERTAKFSPEDAVEDHKKMVDYIRHVIENKDDQKFVVVGHHAPSKLSTHPRYQNDTLMNGGYSSTLDFFIEAHPQIKLWTHGHTHETFDYVLNQTRIVCNPRGYIGYEDRADAFKLKTFEI